MEKQPKQPEFQSSIERKNLRATIKLGRAAVLFDFNNTELYEFPEPYADFDHVYRLNDADQGAIYYPRNDYPHLFEQLDALQFPKTRRKYPSVQDERVMTELWDKQMLTIAEQLINGDES
jgi:hypothetical protein